MKHSFSEIDITFVRFYSTEKEVSHLVALRSDADSDAAQGEGDLVAAVERLSQCPDVVVSKAKGLDLRQFGIFRESRKSASQPLQSLIQHVHTVPLSVVSLQTPVTFQPHHLRHTKSLFQNLCH